MPNKMKRIFSLIFIFFFLQGCSSTYARLTYEFNESKQDNRVFYEDGAENLASEISNNLNQYISVVKKSQYNSFKLPNEIKVYVFANKDRYANFSNSSPLARGSASTNEIYISPIINDRRHTLSAIMIHELSHIHIRQYIGGWRYWSEVPGWFLEGLAVEVSNGGGAESVSDEQAKKLILSGVYFTPREESNIFGHNFANDYGLEPHVYYRQSNLFVRYLQKRDPIAFQKSYLSLIKDREFGDVWQLYYDKTIPELWQVYLKHVRA